MLTELLDLFGIAAGLAVAMAFSVLRARRTQRILGSPTDHLPGPAAPAPPPPPPGPDVAAPLFGVAEDTPAAPLAGLPDLDEPALREALRLDLARLLDGEPARSVTTGAGVSAIQRPPARVLAVRPPALDRPFVDERWATVQAVFTALVAPIDGGGPPKLHTERWALRRPREGGAWEIVQVLEAEARPLGDPRPPAPRYAPLPPGDAEPPDALAPLLHAGLAVLAGHPPTDALTPAFAAELRYQVAAGRAASAQADAALVQTRAGPVVRHGAIERRDVFVDGRVGEARFREVWVLVRGPGGPWRLWLARPPS